MPRLIPSVLALSALLLNAGPGAAQDTPDFVALSKEILIGTPEARQAAADQIVARGGTDMIPTLVLLMRIGGAHVVTQEALFDLTGERLPTWHDAMHYQQAHPEITAHPSYYDLKLWYWGGIDRDFLPFFEDPETRASMRIRFEEITWGGALYDDIPPLDNPALIAAKDAEYMLETDLVFGVEINGDARAYPLRIMGWHEMLNDVIGGMPVSLAYCTLCGAGILFDTQLEGQDTPFVFGSSGLLYRSNKLMFDRQTGSLWNQFTGEPVSGPLAQSELALKVRPVTVATWSEWVADHPDTRVLSLETGHIRNYDSGVVYRDYFASPDLMFPALADETRLLQKDRVYGIRVAGGAKAWPVTAFEQEPVINDQVGFTNVVLIGDAQTRTVRAYERDDVVFADDNGALQGPGGGWQITEDALIGPTGTRLPRLPGHLSYWFAWDGYLGAQSELYQRAR